ncbi:hypothetical protein SSTG_05868 [Streptomyces sp. e14]|nr:hypothetical protein SSTG_05868 [Streptomyces sp. e14]
MASDTDTLQLGDARKGTGGTGNKEAATVSEASTAPLREETRSGATDRGHAAAEIDVQARHERDAHDDAAGAVRGVGAVRGC